VIQTLHTAASGIHFGLAQFDRAARDMGLGQPTGRVRGHASGVEVPGGDHAPMAPTNLEGGPAASLVQAILARHTVEVNTALFRRTNAVAGELLDLVA